MWSAQSLLKPIRTEQPAGDDCGFSNEFDDIKEARRFDDPSLAQGEWESEIKEADWKKVIQISTKLLETKSKDFRLAMWLSEASAYAYGFEGLTEGFKLIAGLCEKFWDHSYPEAAEGDQELRAGNLSWLVYRSEQLIRNIPITEGTPYTYIEITNAYRRAHGQSKEDGNKEHTQLLDQIEAVRRKGSYVFYQGLQAQVNACELAATEMQIQIDARLGLDGPSFSALKQSLVDVSHMLNQFVSNKAVQLHENATPKNSTTESDNTTQAKSAGDFQVNTITTRAQALDQLRLVARFFRETEPHSPVAYLADKAAEWGNLPLHEWLRMVIKDNGSLSHVEELLGLSVSAPQSDPN
ncbi:MAG TPA: type VI secretion system protein TssA [Methylophilaceae bacterium]